MVDEWNKLEYFTTHCITQTVCHDADWQDILASLQNCIIPSILDLHCHDIEGLKLTSGFGIERRHPSCLDAELRSLKRNICHIMKCSKCAIQPIPVAVTGCWSGRIKACWFGCLPDYQSYSSFPVGSKTAPRLTFGIRRRWRHRRNTGVTWSAAFVWFCYKRQQIATLSSQWWSDRNMKVMKISRKNIRDHSLHFGVYTSLNICWSWSAEKISSAYPWRNMTGGIQLITSSYAGIIYGVYCDGYKTAHHQREVKGKGTSTTTWSSEVSNVAINNFTIYDFKAVAHRHECITKSSHASVKLTPR